MSAKNDTPNAQIAKLRAALLARVTEGDIEAAADQLIKLAREGNLGAIKLLFQYTLGKPGAMHDEPLAPVPTAPAPVARPPEASPQLMREIERAILQPTVGLPAVTKRELNGANGDAKRR